FLATNPASIARQTIKRTDARLYNIDNHYQDRLQCVKTRDLPVCDVEIGHRSASICNVANIAYKRGTPLEWDPVKERSNNRAANKLLGKKYRKPYSIGI